MYNILTIELLINLLQYISFAPWRQELGVSPTKIPFEEPHIGQLQTHPPDSAEEQGYQGRGIP